MSSCAAKGLGRRTWTALSRERSRAAVWRHEPLRRYSPRPRGGTTHGHGASHTLNARKTACRRRRRPDRGRRAAQWRREPRQRQEQEEQEEQAETARPLSSVSGLSRARDLPRANVLSVCDAIADTGMPSHRAIRVDGRWCSRLFAVLRRHGHGHQRDRARPGRKCRLLELQFVFGRNLSLVSLGVTVSFRSSPMSCNLPSL
jgi:hypothetical protein